MKNKTKTYILLTLVLGIWGVIGYRILSVANPTLPDIAQQNGDVNFKPKTRIENDTFSIKTVNRDPFLGTLLIKKKSKPRRTKPKEPFIWKPVIYHGIISNQNSKTKVYIVSIDNQQHLMKLGQVVNEVKLIRGNKNSIIVSYKGDRKPFQKHEP